MNQPLQEVVGADQTAATPSFPRVGKPAPEFTVPVVSPDFQRRQLSLADFRGRWLILTFYPRDFSFICPTELSSLSVRIQDFEHRRCDIVGVSVDSLTAHEEWLQTPRTQGGLAGLNFPLASDSDTTMSCAYGVYDDEEGVSLRGLFIIDPQGILQYQVVHNLSTGRHSDEILRVLDALLTGGLCSESWIAGAETIDPTQLLAPGRVVGNYRIEEQLGAGGFAAVFKARDLRLDRLVALKMLKESSRTKLSELLAEARPAAKLSHPNICTVYGVEEHDTIPMIVMEYLPGESLSTRLERGPLEEAELFSFALQLAQGLAAAHAGSIAHGDVKPANVIVAADGTAKLLDFGLARPPARGRTNMSSDADVGAFDPEETALAVRESDLKISGTPAYLSPERTWGDVPSPASDVFAFGAMVYELATGRRAFPGKTLVEVVEQIRAVDPIALSQPLPKPLDEIAAACFQMEAASRPTMAAIAELLDHYR